jgi:phage/plasmid-like protein (TIGR03299 family)
MSANIEMTDGRANIAYTGQSPWHRMGQPIKNAFDAETALREANLDWEVEVKPLFFNSALDPDVFIPEESINRKVIRRCDTGDELGTVGPKYVPLQNKEAFTFFDGLFGKGKCRFDTAGYLGNGGRIWLLAKIEDNDPVEVLKGDVVNKYILLTNDHTGQFAVIATFTPIRVVCENTLTLAIADIVSGKATDSIRVKHIGNVPNRLEFAGRVLSQAGVFYDEVKHIFQAFAAKQLNGEKTRDYIYNTLYTPAMGFEFPEQTKARDKVVNVVEELVETGRGHDIPGVRGTVWGAYNALTEYVDHVKPYRGEADNPRKRLEGSQFGTGWDIKRKALNEGVKLIGAKPVPHLN